MKVTVFLYTYVASIALHCIAFGEVDTLTAASRISASGMHAQSERLKIIAQNLANMEVTGITQYQDPYRRKIIFFKNEFNEDAKTEIVSVERISHDSSDFMLKYQPSHPAADERGYVKYPNVHLAIETVDAKEAQRSFEANLSAFEITKSNKHKLIELIK